MQKLIAAYREGVEQKQPAGEVWERLDSEHMQAELVYSCEAVREAWIDHPAHDAARKDFLNASEQWYRISDENVF